MTGKRYWVIPKSEYRLMVVNNDWVKKFNQLVEKKHRLDIVRLSKEAYYVTGEGTLRKRTLNKKHHV